MAKLPNLAPEDMSADQRRVHDEIAAGPRGTVPAPHQIWLYSPGLCDPVQKVGAYCRYNSHLPPQLSELAIMVVGQNWRAKYEFWAHANIAREVGVSEDIIEAVRTGQTPNFANAAPNSEIVWRVAKEMIETRKLSDASYNEAEAALGRPALVDLVGIVGYYCLVSLTLNVFEAEVPDGSDPFADLPPA